MDRHPAWEGLFSDKPFEFQFGVRPGDARVFFANTVDHERLIAQRQEIVTAHPERHVFQESVTEPAVRELAQWAGVSSSGCCELALHWEQDFLVLFPDAEKQEVFQAGVNAYIE